MVSAVLRGTSNQLLTPDHLRGRVAAVNGVFVQGGPQLGQFEGGLVAELGGARLSAATGGLGALALVGALALAAGRAALQAARRGSGAVGAGRPGPGRTGRPWPGRPRTGRAREPWAGRAGGRGARAPRRRRAVSWRSGARAPRRRRAVILATASKLSLDYGGNPILDEVDLEIADGQRIGVVGENGSGKSTLLKLLAGLESPTGGTIARARNLTVGYLPQEADPRAGRPDGLRGGRGGRAADDRAVGARAPRRGGGRRASASAPDQLDQAVGTLSGGEKKLVGLARLLLQTPDLLLLDEPDNHLDLDAKAWLEEFIRAVPRRGRGHLARPLPARPGRRQDLRGRGLPTRGVRRQLQLLRRRARSVGCCAGTSCTRSSRTRSSGWRPACGSSSTGPA